MHVDEQLNVATENVGICSIFRYRDAKDEKLPISQTVREKKEAKGRDVQRSTTNL